MAKIKVAETKELPEKLIVTGMIVSDVFLAQVIPIYDPAYIKAPFVAIVAKWCIEFYNTHDGKAPGLHIEDIFTKHKEVRKDIDPATLEMIAAFLEDISGEYERAGQFNAAFMLHEAEDYFSRASFAKLSADIEVMLENNTPTPEISNTVLNHSAPTVTAAAGLSVFDAPDFWDGHPDTEVTQLFKMPGALGELMGHFERDTLVGILAVEKAGKTWTMIDIAMHALKAGYNVAFFSVGDLTEPQMLARIRAYAYGYSAKYANKKDILCPVIDCEHNQTQTCPLDRAPDNDPVMSPEESNSKNKKRRKSKQDDQDDDAPKDQKGKVTKKDLLNDFPDHKPCADCLRDARVRDTFKGTYWYKQVDMAEVKKTPLTAKQERLKKRIKGRKFMLFCSEQDTTSVKDIETLLNVQKLQNGFVPDLILVDYADILRSDHEKYEVRHQENKKWQGLRRLSQRYHACVITATQSTRTGYNQKNLDVGNVSEDKRKNAHVTDMLSLQASPEEKRAGVIRMARILAREDEFDSEKCVNILRCFPLGKPNIASYF